MITKENIVCLLFLISTTFVFSQSSILDQIDKINNQSSLLINENPERREKDSTLTQWIIQNENQIKSFLLNWIYIDSTSTSIYNKLKGNACSIDFYQGEAIISQGVYYQQSSYYYDFKTKIYYKCKPGVYEKFKLLNPQVINQYFFSNDLPKAREKYVSMRSSDSVVLLQLQYGKPPWLNYDGFTYLKKINCNALGYTSDSLDKYLLKNYPNQQFELLITGIYENKLDVEVRTYKSLYNNLINDPISWSIEKFSDSAEYEVSFLIKYPIAKAKKIKSYDQPKPSITRRLKREIKKKYKTDKFHIEWESGNERGKSIVYRIKSSEKFMQSFNLYPKGLSDWYPYSASFTYWKLK